MLEGEAVALEEGDGFDGGVLDELVVPDVIGGGARRWVLFHELLMVDAEVFEGDAAVGEGAAVPFADL